MALVGCPCDFYPRYTNRTGKRGAGGKQLWLLRLMLHISSRQGFVAANIYTGFCTRP